MFSKDTVQNGGGKAQGLNERCGNLGSREVDAVDENEIGVVESSAQMTARVLETLDLEKFGRRVLSIAVGSGIPCGLCILRQKRNEINMRV